MSILDILFDFRQQVYVMQNHSRIEEHNRSQLTRLCIDGFKLLIRPFNGEH
jgi:hypothetical protein